MCARVETKTSKPNGPIQIKRGYNRIAQPNQEQHRKKVNKKS